MASDRRVLPLFDLPLSADDLHSGRGKIVGPVVQRVDGGEVAVQPLDGHVIERFGIPQILQAMGSQISDGNAIRQR